MTDEEAREIWDALSSILRKHNLQWILEHALEKVSIGREREKNVDAIEIVYQSADYEAPRRRRKESYRVTEPYSDTERLAILIDAIKTAVMSAEPMLEAIQETLPGSVSGEIEFKSETDATLTHSYSRTSIREGRESREVLNQALSSLKEKL